MRKTLLTLLAAFALAINGFAQTWNMVITRADGTKDTLKTSEVKDVSFFLPDQNVEQVIIKEIYNGGCPSDQGDRFFQQDKGFILYNNCPETAVINNLAVGIIDPFNANAVHLSKWHEGKTMLYEKEGFIPALHGIWWFQSALVIPPYSQVVVCCRVPSTTRRLTANRPIMPIRIIMQCTTPRAGTTVVGWDGTLRPLR